MNANDLDAAGPVHEPITTRSAVRVRPPYDVPDHSLDQDLHADPPESHESWVERVHADRMAALQEPLGFEPTEMERATLQWLASYGETGTVAAVASLEDRNRRFGEQEGRAAQLRESVGQLADLLDVTDPAELEKALRKEISRMRRAATRLEKETTR
ncbi:hypothetical protein [Saccharopolyspora pogona]|uniref:hypothetical protein n=1 Tax=Saccharopolyspora pogona TaxID=333966 RepID=UPI00168989DF|nr:hypothetical protein [Saccharopolyspora pogona]